MNKKYTKRALFGSVIALILCCAMLVGSTFAWFTDSASSAINTIESGNLDISLWHSYFKDAPVIGFDFNAETATEVNENTALFLNVDGNPILWEPGAAAGEVFRVRNDGTLALKYELTVKSRNATATEDNRTLNEVLIVDCIEMLHNEYGTPYTPEGGVYDMGVVFRGEYKITGVLLPGEYRDFAVEMEWEPTDHDNDYNVPGGLKLDLGVELVATQYTHEKDAYGDQYDADAKYPGIPTPSVPSIDVDVDNYTPGAIDGVNEPLALLNQDADTVNVDGIAAYIKDCTVGDINVKGGHLVVLENVTVTGTITVEDFSQIWFVNVRYDDVAVTTQEQADANIVGNHSWIGVQ